MKVSRWRAQACGLILGICSFLPAAIGEVRTFTSNDGREIEAEVTSVAGEQVSLKMAGGKQFMLPISRFSEADQEYLKGWAAKFGTAVPRNAIRLEIEKKTSKIRNERNEGEEKKKYKERIEREGIKSQTLYTLQLRNSTRQPVSDVEVAYKIFKRYSLRGFGELDGSGVEEKLGSKEVGALGPSALEPVELEPFITVDKFEKGKDRNPDKRQNETLMGIVVKVSAGGKELYKKSLPENLIERIQEEYERDKAKAAQEAEREARRAKREEEREARQDAPDVEKKKDAS